MVSLSVNRYCRPPDKAVQESKNRVQAAIKDAGLFFPRKRLVVNLAPASV